jgi:hypothetical protein
LSLYLYVYLVVVVPMQRLDLTWPSVRVHPASLSSITSSSRHQAPVFQSPRHPLSSRSAPLLVHYLHQFLHPLPLLSRSLYFFRLIFLNDLVLDVVFVCWCCGERIVDACITSCYVVSVITYCSSNDSGVCIRTVWYMSCASCEFVPARSVEGTCSVALYCSAVRCILQPFQSTCVLHTEMTRNLNLKLNSSYSTSTTSEYYYKLCTGSGSFKFE